MQRGWWWYADDWTTTTNTKCIQLNTQLLSTEVWLAKHSQNYSIQRILGRANVWSTIPHFHHLISPVHNPQAAELFSTYCIFGSLFPHFRPFTLFKASQTLQNLHTGLDTGSTDILPPSILQTQEHTRNPEYQSSLLTSRDWGSHAKTL